jgi:simple sugar transport system permease protein
MGAFEAMVDSALSTSGLRNSLVRAVPIAGMAFVFAIPYRAGVVNLGGEGMMLFGGLFAALSAIYLPGPSWFVILAAMGIGTFAGLFWAAVPALSQSRLMLPILITSLLLNYIARSITGYLVRFHFLDPRATQTATVAIPIEHRLPVLPILGGVTVSILVVLAIAVAVRMYNRRAVGGYESLMTGFNPNFAKYGGIGIDRQRTRLMLVAGAIAGAVGAHLVLGQIFVYVDGDLVGTAFAWSGLMVALVAPRSPVGILAASFVFAALQVGGLAMQRTTEVPSQLAQVLQATVIIVFVGSFAIKWRIDRRRHMDFSEAERVDADA